MGSDVASVEGLVDPPNQLNVSCDIAYSSSPLPRAPEVDQAFDVARAERGHQVMSPLQEFVPTSPIQCPLPPAAPSTAGRSRGQSLVPGPFLDVAL